MQDKIASERDFTFIYPTWWCKVTAVLKGFYNRVFQAGFAFQYENQVPKGLLKGKRAMVSPRRAADLISPLHQRQSLHKNFNGGHAGLLRHEDQESFVRQLLEARRR